MSHVVSIGEIMVEKDTKTAIVITCKKAGAAIDLTGKTGKLRMTIAGAVVAEKSLNPEAPATDGKFKYQFVTNELKPGIIEGELTIVDTIDSKQITSQEYFQGTVRSRFAAS